MSIIPEEERARLIALGSAGLMCEIADDKHCRPTSQYRDAIDDLLRSIKATEESVASDNRDARETKTLSVASRANLIALIAIIIAVISAHKEIKWLITVVILWFQ